jgi:hypothetical protein
MTITPDPEIHKRLLEKMESRRPHRSGISEIFNKLITVRIPVYQPAFAVAVLVVLFVILNHRNHETIRYIASNDTIYLEKPSPALPIQLAPSLNAVTTSSTSIGKTDSKTQAHPEMKDKSIIHTHNNQYVENAYQKIHLVTLFKRGHSALEDSALIRLLIAAN